MPVGFINETLNVSQADITALANITTPIDFFINVNNIVYEGWLFFIILATLWVILFMSSNLVRDQPLNNAMYAAASCAILSFMLRGIYVIRDGVRLGLITDYQLWIFPIITALLMTIIYFLKD